MLEGVKLPEMLVQMQCWKCETDSLQSASDAVAMLTCYRAMTPASNPDRYLNLISQ